MMTQEHEKKEVEAEPSLKEMLNEVLARLEKQDEAIAALRRENSEAHQKMSVKLIDVHIAAGRR